MATVTVKSKKINFGIIRKDIAEYVLKEIQAVTARGVSPITGRKFKLKDGSNTDLRDTHNLMEKAVIVKEGQVSFNAEYASYVNKRFKFAGLNNRYVGNLLKKIKNRIVKLLRTGQ